MNLFKAQTIAILSTQKKEEEKNLMTNWSMN